MSLLDTASLIVTPNGYKEGKLYSVIPSDGSGDMSVTRATTATRVNSAGLVELVPYNLVQYSNTFSNAVWTKTNTSVTSGQSGYDGSTNAWKLQATATNNCEVDQSFTASETKVFSIYAKAGNVNFVVISVFGAGFGWYNLSNGTLGSSGGTFVSRNIESVGNGWYRCSIVTNVSASGVAVYVADADNSIATTIGSNIFIQDSQLESGSVPTTYQKTEARLNIPRLDYSNGTCPSLLVEPQRTNLALYSSSFDNAAWEKQLGSSVTANTTTAPDGTMSADTLTIAPNQYMYQLQGLSSGTSYTISFYCKVASGTKQFNMVTYSPSGNINYSPTLTATTEWQRFEFTITANATALTSIYPVLVDSFASGSFFIWGAQLEAGSYATSYIPTTSASVTRNADVISKTGISSLIGQTEGTFFIDINNTTDSNYGIVLNQVSGDYTNSIYFFNIGTGSNFVAEIFNGGVKQMGYTKGSTLTIGRNKIAIAYKANDFAVALNGTVVWTDSSGSIPTCNNLDFVDSGIGSNYCYESNAVALWKTRLTNTQLAQLTTI